MISLVTFMFRRKRGREDSSSDSSEDSKLKKPPTKKLKTGADNFSLHWLYGLPGQKG